MNFFEIREFRNLIFKTYNFLKFIKNKMLKFFKIFQTN